MTCLSWREFCSSSLEGTQGNATETAFKTLDSTFARDAEVGAAWYSFRGKKGGEKALRSTLSLKSTRSLYAASTSAAKSHSWL